MLSVEQALEIILNHINVLEDEKQSLLKCLGQVLAQDLEAEVNVPGTDYSGMDGFALRAEDTANASPAHPRFLQVIEIVKAGSLAQNRVKQGTAVRIMTGAQIPQDADCVVRFEDTDEAKRRLNRQSKRSIEIGILKPGKVGENIRPAGENIRQGAVVLSKGDTIGPAEIGILAALGKNEIGVVRRPVAAIISTGDELAELGQPLTSARIYASSNVVIASEVVRCGGIPRILGIARDNKAALMRKIKKGLEADLIITCGGSSGGDYDLVKDVVADMGEIVFWQVCMNPGTSFAFGLVTLKSAGGTEHQVPLFALAGNTPASMVDFEVLVRPAIHKMIGKSQLYPEPMEVVLEESIDNKRGLRRFVWAWINRNGDQYAACVSNTPDKGSLPIIAAANGLVIIPERKKRAEKGEKVQAMRLLWK